MVLGFSDYEAYASNICVPGLLLEAGLFHVTCKSKILCYGTE